MSKRLSAEEYQNAVNEISTVVSEAHSSSAEKALGDILNHVTAIELECSEAIVLKNNADARVAGLVTAATEAQTRVDVLEKEAATSRIGHEDAEERVRVQERRAVAAETATERTQRR